MASKKKPLKHKKENGFLDDVAPHTKQAIVAVFFGVLGIFFVLSALGVGGTAGELTSKALRFLFGVLWYVLAPSTCLFYILILLRPRPNGYVSTPKLLGVTLLFFAMLGLIALYDFESGISGYGGILGYVVVWPLETLLSSIATGVILGALTLIGIFLATNGGFLLPSLLKRTEAQDAELKEDEEPFEIAPQPLEDPVEEVPEHAGSEESHKEAAPRKSLKERVLGKDEFVVESFRGPYAPPPLSLVELDKGKSRGGDTKALSNTIKRTLEQFGIQVEMDEVSVGPSVTRFALKPAEGVKIQRIEGLKSNLEMALAAHPLRIEAPIPGKSLVGIEVPNSQKSLVGMGSLLSTPEFTDSPKPLIVALGKDIAGTPRFADVAKMPHLLVAGATGAGKSVTIHALITSLLFRNSPEQLRFLMIDPKRVELSAYNGIPHLLTPVIVDAKKTILSLKWAAKEMERRYEILEEKRVRDIASYHEGTYRPALKKFEEKRSKGAVLEEDEAKLPEPLPYIVIIIDELADIMAVYPRELEASIVRLAQKSRAVGIHLILSTQRPEVKVITGLIKANIPSRLALRTVSQIDSRTILDQPGAESLLGAGDILFKSDSTPKPLRLQAAYITENEVKSIVDYLKEQSAAHSLDAINFDTESEDRSDAMFASVMDDGDDADDDLYEEARAIVQKDKKASTSYLQRRLRIGYSRAARLMDILEEKGVIGPQDGARPREVFGDASDENQGGSGV